MTISMKPVLIAACVSFALVVPQHAFAKPDVKNQGLLAQLSLTEEQRSALKDIGPLALRKRSRMNPISVFAPVVFTDEIDTVQLDLLVDAGIAQRKALGLIAAEKRFAVRQVLTDAQIEEMQTLLEQKREDKPLSGSLQKRLSNRLSLSAEQQAQMQPYFDAIAELQNLAKTERLAFKAFEQSLLEQQEFDSEAWIAQFELVTSNLRNNSIELANSLHSIYTLLDEEQQQQVKRFAQRSKRFNRKGGKRAQRPT